MLGTNIAEKFCLSGHSVIVPNATTEAYLSLGSCEVMFAETNYTIG